MHGIKRTAARALHRCHPYCTWLSPPRGREAQRGIQGAAPLPAPAYAALAVEMGGCVDLRATAQRPERQRLGPCGGWSSTPSHPCEMGQRDGGTGWQVRNTSRETARVGCALSLTLGA